jgi:mono/diheme cytochrome c family protein
MKGYLLVAGVLSLGLLTTLNTPALAHHSNAAYADEFTVFEQATVTRFAWANPHSLIYFDATDAEGNVVSWVVETAAPLVKHFRLFNRLIETRLFMRHEDGQWAGYSYEWDDSESEAYLLEGAKEKDVNGQTWRYPSRAECLQCHTEAAGRSLGLTSRQLNTFLSDGERLYSQLQMFRDLSLFDFSPDKTRVFAAMDNGDASLGARARSYLDVNCSGCHQPDGNAGRATMDLRIGVPLQEMDICDIEPKVDNLGNLQAKLLRPGDPSSSIIFLRISNHDANRMPPIGSNELDQPAIELMQSWIYSLDQCS